MGLRFNYDNGQTPLTEEEREGLIVQSISSRKELDEFEQLNIQLAVEWSLTQRFNIENILSLSFILNVHKKMFSKTWKWAGTLRKTNKNIGIDKFLILQELKLLIDDCEYWIKNEIYTKDEISIRFKHRLVWIHPFPNGNGRHSRLCADILISRVFEEEVFTWGRLSLVDSGESRATYLDAIYAADKGEITPLLKFARS
ncbi:MAG: mobile mystery protein B [Candidatus Marinimicrobia bacterium]|nr:mobile mystery protein B [Candidatus Neomarinimicrobiota bacterium]